MNKPRTRCMPIRRDSFNMEMRQGLPRDLTRLTLAQVEWCVAYHAAMPLREIRRRQELAERQIGLAWRQRNEFALANLRVREEILRRAAERKLPARKGIAGRRRRPSSVARAR